MEEWRDISGFEGYYQISSHGRIRSLDRMVRTKGDAERMSRGVLLKTSNSGGYRMIILYQNQTEMGRLIHRLVAQAFIPNPDNKPAVNHKDGNKSNNHVSNLEWVTYSENEKHSYKVLGKKANLSGLHKKGVLNKQSKPVIAFLKNGTLVGEFECAAQAAVALGVQTSKISNVCLGKRKQTGGYVFKLKNEGPTVV